MNKKTLFFSNIIGNVMINDSSVRFNDYMSEYLIKNIDDNYSMIFIEAPGLGGEEYYLPNIIRCFDKIGIKFKSIMHVENNTLKSELEFFLYNNDKIVFFLMGGNPYTQLEIIKNLNMMEAIKNHEIIKISVHDENKYQDLL